MLFGALRRGSMKIWVMTLFFCPVTLLRGADVNPLPLTEATTRVALDSLYFREAKSDDDVGKAYSLHAKNRFERLVSRRWMGLFIRYSTFEATGPDRIESIARNAFMRSLQYSAREILLETAIAVNLRHYLDDSFRGLGEFILTSLGSVDEERIESVSLDFQEAEHSWWDELRQTKRIRYGIRPFRTSPYAFIGLRITDGSRKNILFANLRYHFDHFKFHRGEALIAVPLPDKWEFDTGIAYSNSASHKESGRELVWTVRLERPLVGVNPYSSFFVSADLGREERRVLMGLSGSW